MENKKFIFGESEIKLDLHVDVENGWVYLENAIHFMDEEIREEMILEEFEDEQAFVDEYCRRHMEKYDEPYEL